MGIETIKASKVTCQRCNKSVVLENWRDARHLDWVVPADGQVQMCPLCAAYHMGMLTANAITPEEMKEREAQPGG